MSLALSVALHASLLALRFTPPRMPDVHLDVNPTIELGLEEALPGADHPPSAPPSLAPSAPAPPQPPAPRPRVHRPRPAAPPPPPPPPPPPLDLPTPPDTQLRPPLTAQNTPPNGMLLEHDAAAPEADAALALNDAGTLDDVALASADAATEDASDGSGIPALASAAPGLAAAVPEGAVVTLLLRTDRLRENPNGQRVRDMMLAIPDWQDVLGGTEIDPVRDFDQVLLASANPFGTAAHPPDVMALVRLHADRRFVRASIEQMAGVRGAPTGDAGTLYERFQRPDAGRLPGPSRPIWQNRGGAEIATLDRYLGPHAFILLGNDTAAIAPPERVPTLLSVLSRRTSMTTAERTLDTRLVALLQTHGLRNLIRPPPGPVNPVPESLDLVVFATEDAAHSPDGGAELTSRWRYETPAQAESMVRLSEVFVNDMGHVVTDFERSTGGRMAALSGTVHFDRLRATLHALHARVEGTEMVVEATLDREQVAEVLNLQRLAAMFQ